MNISNSIATKSLSSSAHNNQQQLMQWVNIQLDKKKLAPVKSSEQLSSGSIFLQIVTANHPGKIDLSRTYPKPKNTFEILRNFKQLASAFNKLGWDKFDPEMYVNKKAANIQKNIIGLASYLRKTLSEKSISSVTSNRGSIITMQGINSNSTNKNTPCDNMMNKMNKIINNNTSPSPLLLSPTRSRQSPSVVQSICQQQLQQKLNLIGSPSNKLNISVINSSNKGGASSGRSSDSNKNNDNISDIYQQYRQNKSTTIANAATANSKDFIVAEQQKQHPKMSEPVVKITNTKNQSFSATMLPVKSSSIDRVPQPQPQQFSFRNVKISKLQKQKAQLAAKINSIQQFIINQRQRIKREIVQKEIYKQELQNKKQLDQRGSKYEKEEENPQKFQKRQKDQLKRIQKVVISLIQQNAI